MTTKRLVGGVALVSALLQATTINADCGVCAPQCGTNYNNAECAAVGGIQSYPQGAYVNGVTGANTQPPTPCIPAAFDGVTLECPIQYDGPAGEAGTQDNICYVSDPVAHNGTTAAIPQCYNPLEQTCTATNFLCAAAAPFACGRACFDANVYVCITDQDNFFNSQLLLRNQTAYKLDSSVETPAPQQYSSSVGCTTSPPTQDNTTCTAQCASVCGDNFATGDCELLQRYPYNVYVTAIDGVSTVPAPSCKVGVSNGTALNCPIQYDGPAGAAGTQDLICYVSDPDRAEAPWAGSSLAYPECYNPLEATCTGTNLLCPVAEPFACGRACFDASTYVCVIDAADFNGSQLVLRNTTSFAVGANSTGAYAQQPTPTCPANSTTAPTTGVTSTPAATTTSGNTTSTPAPTTTTTGTTTAPASPSATTPAATCNKVDCAPTCAADAFTGKCDETQSYPTTAYVAAGTLQPVTPVAECRAPSEDGVALQCPIQYDGPAGLAGTQDYICYVYYPAVFGDELAHPFCYNPLEQTCTGSNFLCSVSSPLACGNACFSADKYSCAVDSSDFMNSKLIAKVSAESSSTATFPGQPEGQVCASSSSYTTTNSTKFDSPNGTCGCSADNVATSAPTTAASGTTAATSPAAGADTDSSTTTSTTTSKKTSSAHAVQVTVGVAVATLMAMFAA